MSHFLGSESSGKLPRACDFAMSRLRTPSIQALLSRFGIGANPCAQRAHRELRGPISRPFRGRAARAPDV
eukprot:4584887-Alexandrium_andersonii.AAC.1